MQQRIENAAGVLGREHGAGFNGNKDQPEDRGNPGLQKIALVGVQAAEHRWREAARRTMRIETAAPKGGVEKESATPCLEACPDTNLEACPDTKLALFDAIVGGLAGDHYVVDVALAESGAADADEARFLQEFGDGGAAAVSHAGFQSADHLMDDHRD